MRLSLRIARKFGKYLDENELYPETEDDLLFTFNKFRETTSDATERANAGEIIRAMRSIGRVKNGKECCVTWKKKNVDNVYSKSGKTANWGDNPQLRDELRALSCKERHLFDEQSLGTEKGVGTRDSGHRASDPDWDGAPGEKIVWGGKKEEGPFSTRGLVVCPNSEEEGIDLLNAGKKILHSLPAKYVPFSQLQSVKESNKGSRCEETLKAGVKLRNSMSEQQQQNQAAAEARTSADRALDKSGRKQRGKAVTSQVEASTSIGENGNLRVNGKTKGKGRCRQAAEMRDCNLEAQTGIGILGKAREGSVQGDSNGNCMYSSNRMPSCKSLSIIDNASSSGTQKTEKIEELNPGKASEIVRGEVINEKSAAFQVKSSGGCDTGNGGVICPVWKRQETSARALKRVQHSANQSEDFEFRGISASNGTPINARESSNQCGDSLENAKEIGGNEYERRDNVGRQTDGGAATTLEFAENEDEGCKELEGGGICVSHPFPFEHGKPPSIERGGGGMATISVVNNRKTFVKLLAVKLVHSRPSNSFNLSLGAMATVPGESIQCPHEVCLSSVNSFEFKIKTMSKFQAQEDSLTLAGGPWLIEPGHHLIAHLSCVANDIGLHRSSILFHFEDQKIVRHVTLVAEDEVSKELAPAEPYFRSRRRKTSRFRTFVYGVPPPLPISRNQLNSYLIPSNLKKSVTKELPRVLEQGLSMYTYSEYFSTLLYLEELQMKADITAYDMCNVTMSSHFDYLVLKVPGLSEKRPSLIYRDHIYATFSGVKEKTFQGYVYRVEADKIFVKFTKSFHEKFIPNLQYDVQFACSRINLRRCHQAMEAAGGMPGNFLFPCKPLAKMTCKNIAMVAPFNGSLNIEQLSAVQQILNCNGSPPYLVYGPPGTGKTVTIVEAILQILRSNSNARILACAPSNGASDLLLERLHGLIQQREIFRLNARTRQYQDVPSEILPYCSCKDSVFSCPPVVEILKYKVIISTYLSAAILVAQEVPQGHFTHIFLDESGQGTEPETMVPIANLATTETTVVLVGDPQQLGPIVRSPIAEKFGLGKSYLERLSELQLYSMDVEDKEFVTKLVRNYRSHPAILEIPSQLFYGGDLIACAAEESRASLCGWEELPNKKFPVLFVGIEGCDEREGNSPSWFNTVEVSKVIEIIKKLKYHKRSRVGGQDIGVITPYHRQVVKLKIALAANTLSDIKVGSVEQFQGEEKRVIIISTVRSNYKYEEFDKKHNLGFLRNPKRFNVAITRAKSLLVVVGNPHILSKDKYWNELLQHCVCYGSYIGCSLPVKNTAEDDFTHYDKLSSGDCLADSSSSKPSLQTKAAIKEAVWPDGTL